jgi:DNA-binding transcriptional ArsR family regulator
VAVPGWRKYLWALKEREEEFWPKGKPQAAGNYTDTAKIMEVLRKAPGPLPVTDIIDQVAIAFGERPRTKRTHHLGCRIRGCLHFHREQGAVIQVVFPGTQKQLWLLASRKDEFLPGREVGPNNQIVNDSGVLSILASATAPMTAPEIAKAVVLSKGELPTDRNISLAVSRVRQHLRKFFEQGLVREVRIQGSRFGGWLLTEQAKRQLAA